MENLHLLKFKDIDLDDPFFNSLKSDYREFVDWFCRKRDSDDSAFVFLDSNNCIEGFLYLKEEQEPLDDISPQFPSKRRLKVGTFKINPHGTRLGEKFIKKIFDFALVNNIDEIYLTLFEKHKTLLQLFERYGFLHKAVKLTQNGKELVLFKQVSKMIGDVVKNYPNVPRNTQRYLISLKPEWHSRLLPDSILTNEDPTLLIQDTSHTNSIHKIYLIQQCEVQMICNVVTY